MENQTGNAVSTVQHGRNLDGKFAPGNKEAAGGNRNKGWQRMSSRYMALGEKYSPAEIIEFATNDEKRRSELSYWDALAIMRMARAEDRSLTVTDSGADQCLKEAKEIIDRIEGMSVATVRTTTAAPITAEDIDGMSLEEMQRHLDELNRA